MARARAVIIQDGAVALIERRRDGRLYYVFPGGGVEGDETPRQAAVREAREELGLVVAPGPLIAEVVRDGETQFFYLASVTGGAFGSGDGPEMTGAAPARGTYTPIWVSLAELRRLPVYPAAVAGIVAAAAERGWPGVTGRSRAVPTLKRKAFAYITHGDRLLVFRHPAAPDAGIQVPAGSMRTGERPEDAVLREAREETGLADLVLVGALGEHRRDMADVGLDEMHHRYFFHLRCVGDPPATWRHWESDPSDGSSAPILFEFFWARVPDGVPLLIADHDQQLPQLVERMLAEGLIGAPDGGR